MVGVLLLATFGVPLGVPASASAAGKSSPAVKTVVVAGFGVSSSFGAAGTGAQAYFNQVNASGQLKGIKIKYLGFTDDGSSPTTALTAVRGLVTQQHIFAIVPDMSENNPVAYLASQHVPYIGLPIDTTYCSPKPSTKLWGFGFTGCVDSLNPPRVVDTYGSLYSYATKKTGSKHPTFLVFSQENQSGQSIVQKAAASAKGTGFKVVSAKANVPVTAPSDFTPYVEQWMTANGGKPPQVAVCLAAGSCVQAWQALKAVGYTGIYFDSVGNITALAKIMGGTVSTVIYNTAPSAALTRMQNAMNAITPNTQLVGYSNVPGYISAAMFVAALKKVGNNDTPQAVQKALSTMTFQLKGLAGPIKYPASTVNPTPWCSELIADNVDGTFTTLSPYSCSSKTYKN
jgi:ABC-type branched-subunit amino acid transport system substrate-binding protein